MKAFYFRYLIFFLVCRTKSAQPGRRKAEEIDVSQDPRDPTEIEVRTIAEWLKMTTGEWRCSMCSLLTETPTVSVGGNARRGSALKKKDYLSIDK
ncbi:hypothetical protein ElyMa_000744000 [Elysia marginata]|uniref:Uncharacterized protein n=1 Tax=Elysia marginata TaxID=1093978 RepID=A0AAV4GQL9_9GAST|nr:hypothetical protein ElyMa_000744000 [Elysia marginata]